ncbi:MAG: BadF/BadG/BcrA/BcrD ATPase family protein [Paracoccaceae bacterium]
MKSSERKYIIGVDGGGSGCRVAVADKFGAILGRSEGKSANIATEFDTAQENISEAISAAYQAAGLPHINASNDVAVLGLAGANIGDGARKLERAMPFSRTRVTDDTETNLQGALGESDGCIAVLGTGSFFAGRHGGKLTVVGGWGFQLGDDASGAALGKELLRRTILCHDGFARHSDLTHQILAEFNGSPAGIVEFALTAQPKDYGVFAPRIVAAAEKNDATATELLAAAKSFVQRALDLVGLSQGDPLCLLGGLGPIYGAMLDPAYRAHITAAKGDAVAGAVALARQQFAADLEASQ